MKQFKVQLKDISFIAEGKEIEIDEDEQFLSIGNNFFRKDLVEYIIELKTGGPLNMPLY